MEKDFIPYEQALALKELGFDEKCLSCYLYEVKTFSWELNCQISNNKIPWIISAPLYQQAFRFFREKHNLHSYIVCNCSVNEILSYDWIIHKVMNTGKSRDENFITDYEQTFEEAELECLKKLIEIVKEK